MTSARSRGSWTPRKLTEIGFVGRGRSRHRPRNDPRLYGGPHPFFQTGDVKAGGLYLRQPCQTYSDDGLAQSKLWEPGTLCITIAANIAESAILGIRGCFPDSIVGFVADDSKADVRFIKYSLDIMKMGMQGISHGTTQDNLSLEKLLSFDFAVPVVHTQRKIAAILSAYDDLIENNARRIAILEAMAQALYREWFVNFRFPGHQDARMVESQIGPIPEGWLVSQIMDVAEPFRGRSYRSEDLADAGGLPFLNLKCVDRDGGFRTEGVKRYVGPYKGSQVAGAGDIIVAVTDMTQERRIVARAARVPDLGPGDYVCSMDLIRLAPREVPRAYLYATLRWSGFPDKVKQQANGVNVLHLNPACIGEYSFALPPPGIAAGYGDFSEHVFRQCDVLERANANLRSTRNLLLPKLVSGEIDVSDLDIRVPEAAE